MNRILIVAGAALVAANVSAGLTPRQRELLGHSLVKEVASGGMI